MYVCTTPTTHILQLSPITFRRTALLSFSRFMILIATVRPVTQCTPSRTRPTHTYTHTDTHTNTHIHTLTLTHTHTDTHTQSTHILL